MIVAVGERGVYAAPHFEREGLTMKRAIIGAVITALAIAGLSSCSASAGGKGDSMPSTAAVSTSTSAASEDLSSKTLQLSDMPTGWQVTNPNEDAKRSCFKDARAKQPSTSMVTAEYEDGSGDTYVDDTVARYGQGAFDALAAAWQQCSGSTADGGNGITLTVELAAANFEQVGDRSKAWGVTVHAKKGTETQDEHGYLEMIQRNGLISDVLFITPYGNDSYTAGNLFKTAASRLS